MAVMYEYHHANNNKVPLNSGSQKRKRDVGEEMNSFSLYKHSKESVTIQTPCSFNEVKTSEDIEDIIHEIEDTIHEDWNEESEDIFDTKDNYYPPHKLREDVQQKMRSQEFIAAMKSLTKEMLNESPEYFKINSISH